MPYNKAHGRRFIERGERKKEKAEKGAKRGAETSPWGQE